MSRRNLLAGILLGLTGFIINWFKLSLFFNVDFLFGSTFSMFAVLRFGPATGLLAAVIAAACSWYHWHHPWAIVIFGCEAFCAGWLRSRKKLDLMNGDIIYWLTGGLLLVWLFYHQVMGFSAAATLLVALKQGVNGIFNTLFAETLFLASRRLTGEPELPSLRKQLRITMQVLVLVPAFLLAYADTDRQFRQQTALLQQDSARIAEVGSLTLSGWMKEQRDTVTALANLVGDPGLTPPREMQRVLEKFHAAHSDIYRLGIMDRSHVTRAFSPPVDEKKNSTIGIWLGDRPYIAGLNTPSHPIVYEVFMGRLGYPGPRLIVLAPSMSGNEYRGAVFCVTTLDQQAALLRGIVVRRQIDLTLVDKESRVVATTHPTMKFPERLTLPGEGRLQPVGNGVSQWIPDLQPGESAMKRWLHSYYLTEVELAPESGFRLVVEAPLKPVITEISNRTSILLGVLATLSLVTICLSHYFSHLLIRPIAALGKVTSQLPARIARGEQVTWSPAGVTEEQNLQDNFRMMESILQQSFREMNVMNEGLEQRVVERTTELQKSRDEWERTFNAMADLIFIIDQDYRITRINQAALDALQTTKDAIIGEKCCVYMHGTKVPPNSCPQHETLYDHGAHVVEAVIERLGRHFQISTTPIFNDAGAYEASVHVAHDITDRKRYEQELQAAKEVAEAIGVAKSKSEEQVRILLNSTAEAIYGIDLQGNCTFANPACLRVLGYTDVQQLLGQNMHQLIHHSHPDGSPMPGETCHIYQAFREGCGMHRNDEVLWRADGTSFPVEYWSHPQIIEGEVIGAVVTFYDITERLQTQEQLALKQEQLELLNRSLQQRVDEAVADLRRKDQVLISQGRQAAMGEMIGNIAHQWRQPLNALAMILSNLQFAHRGKELTAEYLDESIAAADRLIQKMSTTINDFRNFFSPDKEIVVFSAMEQICHAVDLVNAAFQNSNITISIRSECDSLLKGFPNEYSQVLLNLLSNAKDAIVETGSKPGYIVVTLKEEEGMGVVTVRDNGGGIPEAILDKVFEPYFTTKNMGTGIGLYMSKMIIEHNMHGVLTVKNIDAGCEFSVYTPIAEKKS